MIAEGFWVRCILLRQLKQEAATGSELCCFLDALEQGIGQYRKPLPDLLRSRGNFFTKEVLRYLQNGKSFGDAWRAAANCLPCAYRAILSSLGETLTGGDTGGLIKLTREEVYRIASEKRRAFQQQNRLITTLCMSASLLTVVVLI